MLLKRIVGTSLVGMLVLSMAGCDGNMLADVSEAAKGILDSGTSPVETLETGVVGSDYQDGTQVLNIFAESTLPIEFGYYVGEEVNSFSINVPVIMNVSFKSRDSDGIVKDVLGDRVPTVATVYNEGLLSRETTPICSMVAEELEYDTELLVEVSDGNNSFDDVVTEYSESGEYLKDENILVFGRDSSADIKLGDVSAVIPLEEGPYVVLGYCGKAIQGMSDVDIAVAMRNLVVEG